MGLYKQPSFWPLPRPRLWQPTLPTLVIDTAAFAVTANAVVFQTQVPISTQTYAVTANDVLFQQQAQLSVSSYTYTVNSSAFQTQIPLQTLSYSATANEVAFQPQVQLAVNSYTHTVNGAAFQTQMPISTGSYTITVNDANLTTGTVMSIDAAAFAATVNDVSFQQQMAFQTGAYTVTGNAVAFIGSIGAATATYALTHNDALFQTVMAYASGSYEVVVNDAVLQASGSITYSLDTLPYTVTISDIGLIDLTPPVVEEVRGGGSSRRRRRREEDRRFDLAIERKHLAHAEELEEIQRRIEGRIERAVSGLPDATAAAVIEAAQEEVDERIVDGYQDHLTVVLGTYGLKFRAHLLSVLALVREAIIDREIAELQIKASAAMEAGIRAEAERLELEEVMLLYSFSESL